MKLVWSPEIASNSYIDTAKSCKLVSQESGESELISAMAGGWNANMIVEAWSSTGGCTVTTSVGLAIAAKHAGARHVCVVENERSRMEYASAMQSRGISSLPEIVVGEAEEVMVGLVGVDFLVVDGRRKDFSRLIKFANLSHLGAVLICRNASQRTLNGFRWSDVLGNDSRIVRTNVLPVGKGLDIAYVAKNLAAGLVTLIENLAKSTFIEDDIYKYLKADTQEIKLILSNVVLHFEVFTCL